MAHSKDLGTAKFLEAYGYRNAIMVKTIGEWTDALDLETPSGKEKYVFSVGQKVLASGEGVIKAGVELLIKDREMTNGFCQYLAGGVWNKQEDLMVA